MHNTHHNENYLAETCWQLPLQHQHLSLCMRMGKVQVIKNCRRIYQPHFTNFYLALSDGMHWQLDGRELKDIRRGSLFFNLQGQTINFHAEPGDHYLWGNLTGVNVLQELKLLGVLTGAEVLAQNYEYLEPMLNNIYDVLASEHPLALYSGCSHHWQVMSAIQQEMPSRQVLYSNELNLAGQARKIIDNAYGENLQIADVCRRLAVSEATLYRHFTREFGEPPKTYLSRLRLGKACELLQNSQLSIAEVGFSCGFSSAQSFNRFFQQQHQVSPGAWRKRTF